MDSNNNKNQSGVFGILSIIFAILSLVIFPPFFGLLGVIFGVIGIVRKEGVLPIISTVLSVVFCIIGMYLGMLTALKFLR